MENVFKYSVQRSRNGDAIYKKEADIDGKREFWLIVLTDGAFNDLEKDKVGGKEQILQKLAQFKKEMDEKRYHYIRF